VRRTGRRQPSWRLVRRAAGRTWRRERTPVRTKGQYLRAARLSPLPCYSAKTAPTFGDTLATLRRAS
jgi:hypothetical protein